MEVPASLRERYAAATTSAELANVVRMISIRASSRGTLRTARASRVSSPVTSQALAT